MFVRQLADASTLTRDPLRERGWTQRFLLVWAALFLFRLFLLLLSPLELSGDEAYYWEWGRRLDYGYFSKPPLIGWLMALFGWIGGDTTWGIRLGALLCGSAALLPLFLLGRSMFNAEAGFWAAVALAFTPGHLAASFFFTIDAPLLLAWSLALWATWTLVQTRKWSPVGGLGLILALAMGLLSKQMMLVFPLLACAYLVLESRHRHWLTRPAWWLCLLAGSLALVPPVLWNAQHDWVTFTHTAGTNLRSTSVPAAKQLGRWGEFVGAQFVLVGPVLLAVLAWLLGRSLRCWGRLQPAERFLWIFCAPALLVFLVLAARMRALPNWPAVFYPAGFVLLGGWVASHLSCSRMHAFGRGVFRFGLGLGVALTLAVHLALFILPNSEAEVGGEAPLRRLMGWQDYAREVEQVARDAFGGRPHALVVVGHRYHASALAFYHPEHPVVYLWNDRGRPTSQYDLWPGAADAPEPEALLIIPHEGRDSIGLPASLASTYGAVEELGDIRVGLSPRDGRRYTLFKAQRLTTDSP
jgi:4-amino-4-deoxy-L-arabinose transferase-like glycosyltransferase